MSQLQDPKLREFLKFCREKIGYKTPAKIRIYDDHEVSKKMKSMAAFLPDTTEIWVLRGQRTRADWYRSLAHELVHHKQREDGMEQMDGSDGSDIENEANSLAGVILREYGRLDSEIYQSEPSVTRESLLVKEAKLNIHATRKMIESGMLVFDPQNVDTWPAYYKRLRWIKLDLDDINDSINSGKYDLALEAIDNLKVTAKELETALGEAWEEKKDEESEPDEPEELDPTNEALYDDLQIYATNSMIRSGMLDYDNSEFEKTPKYIRLLNWITDNIAMIKHKLEESDYKSVLYYANEIVRLADDFHKGADEAVRDAKLNKENDQDGTP